MIELATLAAEVGDKTVEFCECHSHIYRGALIASHVYCDTKKGMSPLGFIPLVMLLDHPMKQFWLPNQRKIRIFRELHFSCTQPRCWKYREPEIKLMYRAKKCYLHQIAPWPRHPHHILQLDFLDDVIRNASSWSN